ncbi:MAG TPA: hydroxyphenylacetyl-CoA thioesterase PaaI [Woeseiaceae bacterium]|nr:hydroxyphenylacetyl-CoA thioesterase PaaI [Woeseiaceae bacterium]
MDELELARRCAEAMWADDKAAQALGIRVEVTAPGAVRATMEVTAAMINGHDVCHGGYLFTLADTAFAFACNAYGRVSLAAAASIDFLRPAKLGDRLTAEAAERHRGRRAGIYEVTVIDQDDAVIALFHGRSHTTDRPLLPSAEQGRGAAGSPAI